MTKRKHRRREHRTFTPQQAREIRVGGEYLGPGVWVDRHGMMHFSVPEILQHFGLPDTPEQREHATRELGDLLAEFAPDAQIIETDEGTDG